MGKKKTIEEDFADVDNVLDLETYCLLKGKNSKFDEARKIKVRDEIHQTERNIRKIVGIVRPDYSEIKENELSKRIYTSFIDALRKHLR